MGRFINAHVPWLSLMALIAIQSSLTGFSLPDLGLRIEDKIIHFIIFGVLGWLIARGFDLADIPYPRALILALIIGVLFSLLDEFHQKFVVGRQSSILDLLADLSGMILFIFHYFRKKRKTSLAENTTH